ncbi:thioredoxin domain-containing protein [Antarcticibacterium sp. 1MA-6-2]|uniref:thioredoxin domain-containing protein n=1 Tax=Antarcticibacterium sp. 1MA-6-2 TaxID=2908210 RepID=UPI001F3EA5F9|nr:thioredoxin domain-containing protein [Antarcticibacterium sp. 1MA-6-2]UJH90648.1 thioredoxin domain-containing protein [Antarcticibacterium sp. 1MA-6-2]
MAFKIKFILPFLILTLCTLAGCKNETEKELTKGNRLARANSPYLQEHADNPVDWYEWGPEALEKAREEDKPIIISVGYASCHWCHVMERESFMDSSVAKIMNRDFVSIKIDREERPDIDKIYMNAAQLLNGSGGWPLNAVTLPNGKPFFAGTYFPPEEWKNILTQIAKAYKENKEPLIKTANALTEGIKSTNKLGDLGMKQNKISKDDYIALMEAWEPKFDTAKGGYRGEEKFPLPVSWDALLQYYYLTENEKALEMVKTTLDNLARGGIYDQLGGGFSRYTTDPDWLIPHFEKMLYDNAQLISLYSKAYKVIPSEEYKNVIVETIQFVERELSNNEGGFYSSLNADTDGEEGKYYVWSLEELRNTLAPSEIDLVTNYFNIEPYGNWERGKNILFRKSSMEEFARREGVDYSKLQTSLNEARKKLLKQRQTRIQPSVDDKSLTSWNALMIEAYLEAFLALNNPEYLQRAIDGANFLNEKMLSPDSSLWRSYKDGKGRIAAFLDDYAMLSQAYIHLYQITLEKEWLTKANKIVDYAISNFRDDTSGMFYYTSKTNNNLVAQKMELDDNVIPSSNSVMAKNLFILGTLLEQEEYLKMSEKMMSQMYDLTMEDPSFYANWTKLMGTNAFGAYEIAIVGHSAQQKNFQVQNEYLPTSIFMGGNEENLPLLENKLVEGETLIYVCQNKTCKYPVSLAEEAIEIIGKYHSGREESTNIWN